MGGGCRGVPEGVPEYAELPRVNLKWSESPSPPELPGKVSKSLREEANQVWSLHFNAAKVTGCFLASHTVESRFGEGRE